MIAHSIDYPKIFTARTGRNILTRSTTDGLNNDTFQPEYTITTTLSFNDTGFVALVEDLKVVVGKYTIAFSTSPVNDWDVDITGMTTFAQLNTYLSTSYDYTLFPDYAPIFALDFEEVTPGVYRPRIQTTGSTSSTPYVVEDQFNFITENFGTVVYTKPANQPIGLAHIIQTGEYIQRSVASRDSSDTLTSSFDLNEVANTFLPLRNGRLFIAENVNQELPTSINLKYFHQDQFGKVEHMNDYFFLIDSARGAECRDTLEDEGWLNPSLLVRSNNVLAIPQVFGVDNYVPSSVDPQTFNYFLLHDDDPVHTISFTNYIPWREQGGDGSCTLRAVFTLSDGTTTTVNVAYPSGLSVFHVNVSATNGYGVGYTPPPGTRVLQAIFRPVYGVNDTNFGQPVFGWYVPVAKCPATATFVFKNTWGGLSTAKMSMENTRLADASPVETIVNTLRTSTLRQVNNGGADTVMDFVMVTSDYSEYQEAEQLAYTDRVALMDIQVLPGFSVNDMNLVSNVIPTKIETSWQDNVGTVRLSCKILNKGI